MADLHWFPFMVSDWLGSSAIADMLPEQEGAYIRLLATAWGNGSAEPSLPTSDRSLAQRSRLGARWAELGPLIREQFVERDGRLFNDKQVLVWQAAQSKHAKAVKNGKKGARIKADRKQKRSHPSATLEPPLSLAQAGTPANTEQLQEAVSLSEKQASPGEDGLTAPSVALALDAPAPSERPVEDRGRVTTRKAEMAGQIASRFLARFGPKPAEAT